ncbi:MAG TPA: protein kinase [Gemmataceae bacterium]|nr:protein kinase [Gemmataceae bacterium]
MSQQAAERKTLEVLAEEFVARYRRGERPALSEYIDAHPELAAEIRELFPALVMMEELAPSDSGSAAAATIAASEQPRLSLGDYRLLREIGRGGMGVVYEAEQLSLGRRVALKVLHRHAAADSTIRQRFHREARAAAQLHHTNIVPVFEVGENQEVCWYAMQLILGQGLDQIIEELRQHHESLNGERPAAPRTNVSPALSQVTQALVSGQFACPDLDASTPPPAPPQVSPDSTEAAHVANRTELSVVDSAGGQYYRSVARIGRQAAEALAYAHTRVIIHRDIKPSNLLLDAAGVVWITDFGLAKTQDHSLTTTGDIVGTLRYMAPERFQGEGDERADVYGLGLTLYELLVLRPAFVERDRLQLIDRIKNQEPPRPRALDRRIPRDLETIILKAIDKEAKRRYASAEALAEDLRRFLADEPIRARRTSELERLRLWGRRNPAVASLLGVVFLLLVCLTIGSLAAAFWLNHQRLALAAAEEDRTEKLYQSLVAQAKASHFSRRVGQRFATLDAVRKAAALVRERCMPAERLDELRNLAIAALVLPDLQTLRTWEGFPGGSFQWDTDEQLRRYARTDLEGNISLRWTDSDEEIAHLKGWRGETAACFSPGDRFLSAHNAGRFRVWDLSATPPRLVQEGQQHGCVFHPDGRHLLIRPRNGSMSLHDLADPKQNPRVLMARQMPHAFDPAGNRLAAIDGGKVHILDARTGKLLSSLPEKQSAYSLAWHPSGNYLALALPASEIRIWDLKRMKVLSVLKGCRNGGIFLAFTPDGERLLSNGWEGVVRVWSWRTGQQVVQVSGRSNLRCGADGRLLICQGSRLSLVELAGGREYRSFVQQSNAGNEVDYWHCRIHPGGRLVAVSMSDGERFFDLQSGEELGFLPQKGYSDVLFLGKEAVLTNATASLVRWPIQADEANPNRLRLGPPKRLRGGNIYALGCDKTGDVIGQAAGIGAFVVRPNQSPLFLGPHTDTRGIRLSSDGKYAATGTHNGDDGVKVWDAETGQLLVRFAVGGLANGVFSPDGKWLAVSGTRGCRLVKCGTWEERPLDLGSPMLFSPDSALLAVQSDRGVIRLLAPETLQEVARLEDPNQDRPSYLAFHPDGSKLLVSSDDARAFHLWDLRSLRTQLAELGLDWDMPPLPPAPTPSPEPLRIDIDMGDYQQIASAAALVRQAAQHIRANKHAVGLAELRKAVRLAPCLAEAHNNLAWELLTGPQELRDPAQALAEARQAVALEDYQATYQNTLGVALYRTGRFAEAVPVLERSLREGKGQTDAFDLFFLAMCHHRLGDAARARDYHDRSIRWFQEQGPKLRVPGWLEELTAFQAESASVLAEPPGKGNR